MVLTLRTIALTTVFVLGFHHLLLGAAAALLWRSVWPRPPGSLERTV